MDQTKTTPSKKTTPKKKTPGIKQIITELFLPYSKSDSEKIRYSKDSIASKSAALLFGSIFGIIVAILLDTIVHLISNDIGIIILDFLSNFIEDVSGLIFAASIGTIMLDFFSYINYAQERIKEVVIDKDFLKTVNDDEKKKIISTLESSLYFKGEDIPPDSLYTNIKETVIPLLDMEYYEKYHTHIDCDIKDGKIYKKIYNDFSIFSPKENSVYKLPFSVYFSLDDIGEIETPYSFQNLCFNDVPINISSNDTVVNEIQDNTDVRKKSYTFQRSLNLKQGLNSVYYEITSIVDCSDNIYSRTITIPCKNYVVDFHMKNPDYCVKVHGFAIDVKDNVKIKYYANTCRIEFTDWVIPGDGFIFIINKKKEDEAPT